MVLHQGGRLSVRSCRHEACHTIMNLGTIGRPETGEAVASRRAKKAASLLFAFLFAYSFPATGAWLQLGATQVHDGLVYVPVVFDPGAASVASLQFDLQYDPGHFAFVHLMAGPAAISAGKDVLPGAQRQRLTVIVAGLNQTAIPAGVLAEIYLEILPDAQGEARISLGNMVLSDARGGAVDLERPQSQGGRNNVVRDDDSQGDTRSGTPAEAAPGAEAPQDQNETGSRGFGGAGSGYLPETGGHGMSPDDGAKATPLSTSAGNGATAPGPNGTPGSGHTIYSQPQTHDGTRISPPSMTGLSTSSPRSVGGGESAGRGDTGSAPSPWSDTPAQRADGDTTMLSREQIAALRAAQPVRNVPVAPLEIPSPAPRRTPTAAIFLVVCAVAGLLVVFVRRVGNDRAGRRTIRR